MDGKKYVQCTHKGQVTCRFELDGEEREIVFTPYRMNKYTGVPDSYGYTEVSDKELAALEKSSSLYRSFKQQRLLHISSEMPASARSAPEIIADKMREVDLLKKEAAEKDAEIKRLNEAVKQLSVKKESKKETKTGEAPVEPEGAAF